MRDTRISSSVAGTTGSTVVRLPCSEPSDPPSTTRAVQGWVVDEPKTCRSFTSTTLLVPRGGHIVVLLPH